MKSVITCSSGKKIYASQTIAEDILIDLWSNFDYSPTQGPISVYQCEDCGFFHLTSQGNMSEKLAKELENGNIKRAKEANKWANKLKKR